VLGVSDDSPEAPDKSARAVFSLSRNSVSALPSGMADAHWSAISF
jgi:hypothetical protein